MYCKNCGKEIDDKAEICPHCGVRNSAGGNVGWAILGFLFPIVGLILYLVWKNSAPKNAKMAGIGALIAVLIELVLFFIVMIVVANTPATY